MSKAFELKKLSRILQPTPKLNLCSLEHKLFPRNDLWESTNYVYNWNPAGC